MNSRIRTARVHAIGKKPDTMTNPGKDETYNKLATQLKAVKKELAELEKTTKTVNDRMLKLYDIVYNIESSLDRLSNDSNAVKFQGGGANVNLLQLTEEKKKHSSAGQNDDYTH